MAICRCTCGAKFKVPDQNLGKKGKCRKCGSVFTLTEEEEGIIPIADDLWPDTDEITRSAASAVAVSSPAPPPGYRGVVIETSDSVGAGDDSRRHSKGFLGSVLWTLLFPSTPANLFTYIGILVFLSIGVVASVAPFVGGICLFAVSGWYAAFRFNILQSAATGDSELPGIGFPTDWLDDVIVPFFAWLGSWLVALLPAFAYVVVAWQTGKLTGFDVIVIIFGGFDAIWAGPAGAPDIYHLFVGLSLAVWPMIILCIALGGFASLARIDLIFVTLAKSFPAYSVVVVLTVGVFALGVALQAYVAGKVMPTPGTRVTGLATKAMGFQIAVLAITVYADIVMMRLIGLYYHHFKHKFAWSWG